MLTRFGAPLLLVCLLLAGFAATRFLATASAGASEPAAAAAKRWVCPPCSAPCDTMHFAAAGTCPQCGMALVEEGSAAAQPPSDQKKVAILVFNGCEILDFSGPYEMFGAAGCDVYTVAANTNPVTTAMGLTVVPKFSFANAPQPDVLVIPGGGVKAAAQDEATLRYIKDVTGHTTHTMSVCNGAFILANTGLLDGLSATTTNGNIPRMASQYPKIKVVRDRRYVDNGKLITTAGLSAGMDGALHVIANLFGTGYAQQVALGEEYDWKASAGYARAALADHELPQVDMDRTGTWKVARTEGDTRHWEIVMDGNSNQSFAELTSGIEKALTDNKWKLVGSPRGGPAARTTRWSFTGSDGKAWSGTVKVEAVGNSGHDFHAAVAVERAG
jgi:putative intracellular protease/amidase